MKTLASWLIGLVLIGSATAQQFTFADRAFVARLSAVPYVAGIAEFDGTNDYMRITSAGLTGLADGKAGRIAVLLNLTGSTDAAEYTIFSIATSAASARLTLRRLTNNKIQLSLRSSAAATAVEFSTTTSVVAASGLVHYFAAWDAAVGAASNRLYLNGAADTPASVTNADLTIQYIGTDHRYTVGANGASTPANRLLGSLGELFFNDVWADDVTTFFAGGVAVNPGATATAGVIWLHGTANDFDLNDGTGEDFTITGSLGP